MQRAKEPPPCLAIQTLQKGKWKGFTCSPKTHADQTKSPLCNDFHTFFPNAWYVENKLLPFSYKRAITFTSFHPSNLIVSFCKLTNKHRVFPMEDYTWIQNCSNCRSLTWSWGALFGTRARMGLSAIMTYAGGAYYSHSQGSCLGSFSVESKRVELWSWWEGKVGKKKKTYWVVVSNCSAHRTKWNDYFVYESRHQHGALDMTGGFKYFFLISTPTFGKIPNLTSILFFRMGLKPPTSITLRKTYISGAVRWCIGKFSQNLVHLDFVEYVDFIFRTKLYKVV